MTAQPIAPEHPKTIFSPEDGTPFLLRPPTAQEGRSRFYSKLFTVIRHNPHDLPIPINLHKLPRLPSNLIRVIEHYGREPPHHVFELELQIWKSLEPFRKISTQRRLPSHIPRRITQQSRRHWRSQHHAIRVVFQNRLQIMRIPTPHPLLSKIPYPLPSHH